VREASLAARREVSRLRDFNRMLLISAIVLAIGAAGMVVLEPERLPVCFTPDNTVVCATST
jgi:hypothetical protein